MATVMPSRQTSFQMQMGGEGVNWIAQAPFTSEKHVFVNMGDGTYTHSGLLAIRAAAAAKVNVTYKILYNDAVAMTGGQPPDAGLTVSQIAHEVAAEGAKRIVIVAEDPDRHHAATLPPNCSVRDRADLESVQMELRGHPGLSVLIYDQVCAAEKRRRRKRGQYPKSPVRVFINSAVCEGCGDCSVKSNCISVAPLETAFGRKRRVDQSSCNMDTSCIKGFCPSFVTIRGGEVRTVCRDFAPYQAGIDRLPEPASSPLNAPYRILVTGVGGTGVITVGALLGMAGHLDGRSCSVLDFTGLAQKNGPVTSHVQLAPNPEDLAARRIGPGRADLILGADIVVAAGPAALPCAARGYTRAVINSYVQSVAAFVLDSNLDFQASSMRLAIKEALGDPVDYVDATSIAMALFGDSIFANLFLLGIAFQKGLIPVSANSLLKAIELNATAVETNTRAFQAGRLYALEPGRFAAELDTEGAAKSPDSTLPDLIEHRARFLKDYQDRKYALHYRDILDLVIQSDRSVPDGNLLLSAAVARNLFKLMAYKDEYEVARLQTMPEFTKALADQFSGNLKLSFHLAPPLLARKDPVTGEPRKIELGGWILVPLKALASLRRLRGTPFDIFGYTTERRMERRLVTDYIEAIQSILPSLSLSNYELAIQIANVPHVIRGYGHVKLRSVLKAEIAQRELLAQFQRLNASVVGAAEKWRRAPSEA
jgi:indolepyruvate ferredoxin oxidoreductase